MKAQMSEYIQSKLDNKLYCKDNGHFTKHLRKNNLNYQQYHETYVTGIEEKCPYCNNPKTFYQANLSYAQTCGSDKCYGDLIRDIKSKFTDEKNKEINDKRKKTIFDEHGVEFNRQVPAVIAKIKKTMQQVMPDGKTKKEHQQEAVKQSKLEKHGDEFYNNVVQIKASKAARTVEQENETTEKRRKTNLAIYGVENTLLLSDNARKTAKGNSSIKDFIMPSGKIVGVRGAENKAIVLLLKTYVEHDMIISDSHNPTTCGMPILPYINVNKHTGDYYPDILIPKENKIIEVKSRWWYDGNGKDKYKSRLENNQRKRQACLNAGYIFEFWIYEKNNNGLTILP